MTKFAELKDSILSKNHTVKSELVPIPNEQVDERDTMFARMARKTNTTAYSDYYSRRHKLKKRDDNIRRMPPLLHPKSKYYDKDYSELARQLFDSIEDIKIDEKRIDEYLRLFKSNSTTETIKQITLELGAVAVGCTNLELKFVYSYKGRFDSTYGEEIQLNHPNAIMFLVEMNFDNMQSAPKAPTIYESANQYYRAAEISKYLEKIIIKLGFEAKAHYDACYDVILPPLAVQAGLGEIGRNNILISDKFGSRVRIGAVTTNIPLDIDIPKSIGVECFCRICKKCATNCPSRALSFTNKTHIRGVDKWTTNVENCYSLWRKYSTDCGICMAVCPFSHKNNWYHNLVRNTVKYFPICNRILVWFDDFIYGKKWKIK